MKTEKMKRFIIMVVFIVIAVGIAILAYNVWTMPHKSNVAIFRIIMIGFIPLPIPIGLFSSPHFGGGILFMLAFLCAAFGIGQVKK
jgi:hypothetical protein